MGGATRFFVLLSGPLPLLRHHRPSFLRLSFHYHKYSSSSSSPLHPNNARFPPILSSSFQPIRTSRHLHSHVSTVGDDFLCSEDSTSSNNLSSPPPNFFNGPEWSKLLQNISTSGFFARQDFGGIAPETEFVDVDELPADFVRVAMACLAFARDRAHLLGLLSRRDVEVVVENGSPNLFRDADATMMKMKKFLQGSETHVLDSDKAQTIDLFKFILSYTRNPIVSSESNPYSRDLVESSMRNLLGEIWKLCFSDPNLKFMERVNQFPDKYEQPREPYGQKVEMKRGDWICPRCSFMNFARNVKCLECEEARPKRQLSGGEWECPQCDFFNYGRNLVCLRCDCKRPGPPSLSNININSGMGYENGSTSTKVDIDSRLAANEEKAQRWFSKISQLDSASDLGSSITDEDFPEIMPLRKGVNRFVVSTRKTPLERRLANAEFRKNLGNDGVPENDSSQLGAANRSLDKTISQSLDDILGRTSGNSQSTNVENGKSTGINRVSSSGSGSLQYESTKGINSGYVPFVPMPPDMFAKKPHNSSVESDKVLNDTNISITSNSVEQTGSAFQRNEFNGIGDNHHTEEKSLNQSQKIDKGKDEAEKSERWFKRVAELHNETDLASAISDEDFPEIMPMRKGENRFVVSKKKDRSLTSPAYKKRVAMEQAGSSNFVQFVPFPPDYFAKKDEPLSDDSTIKVTGKASSSSAITNNRTKQLDDARIGLHGRDYAELSGNQQSQTGRFNSESRAENWSQNQKGSEYQMPTTQSSSKNFGSPHSNSQNVSSTDYLGNETNKNTNTAGSSSSVSEIQNIREKWSGKSLEGSAVTEPDPLDMSEEAKAQRWFRRVAQIKDISELSQIPDEDFPSIMPMRKGVNRFVVSKRKTPLERRLTSPQYRRNLPIVTSDPPKRENESS